MEMTKLMLSLLMIFFSLIMMFLNNPLSMGLLILIQTMLISLLSGMIMKTYWFSYILFLTFMGGLLVLFIYVCSIASNELFKSSLKLKLLFILWLIMFFNIQLTLFYNLFWMNLSFNSDMNNFMSLYIFMIDNYNKINLNKLYNNQNFLIMIMLMIYLFITLIAVVKITNIFYGPIRSKFN